MHIMIAVTFSNVCKLLDVFPLQEDLLHIYPFDGIINKYDMIAGTDGS